ncbi:MAG: hypothetical protein KDA84_23585, partial [Planctomycetaceae bacterium]|nr:hypothetical protein [Planctomycetaceae bacterium]
YCEVMGQFIRDVRKEFSAPNMPFVIGVIGVGGPVEKYGPDQQRYKGVHQNIRDAMAAPAKLPEFKNSVAAVLTENYWDMSVVELRKKEKEIKPQLDKIRQQIKDKKLSREEGNTAIDELYKKTFSSRELVILKDSVSNADYHYMGSGKVMTQIGKGFADAMLELMKKHTP